jgi:hypothetical protein
MRHTRLASIRASLRNGSTLWILCQLALGGLTSAYLARLGWFIAALSPEEFRNPLPGGWPTFAWLAVRCLFVIPIGLIGLSALWVTVVTAMELFRRFRRSSHRHTA